MKKSDAAVKAVRKEDARCSGETFVQVPIQVPTKDELEAIYLKAAEHVMRERDTWLTIAQAAAYLKMARRTFDDLRRRWRIPVSEVGKLIDRRDLDQLVEMNLVQAKGVRGIDFRSLERRGLAILNAGGQSGGPSQFTEGARK